MQEATTMVDRDVFASRVAPGWGASARAAGSLLPVEVLGDQLGRDLYRDLRRTGGLRGARLLGVLHQVRRCTPGASDPECLTEALGRYAWERCLSRIVPQMVYGGAVTVAEALAYFERALSHARLEEAATRLLRNPDARLLRRPQQRQRSTAELLDEEAPLGPSG